MNLFGKKKKAEKKAPSAIEVIAQLKEAQEQVEKRQVFLQAKRDQAKIEGQTAYRAKDTQKAAFHLKRMKTYEKEITANYGKISNLESQCNALESATSDKSIFEAMRLGQEKLKESINEDQLDKVADLLDDMQEVQQLQTEISDALARPVDGMEIDDDELFAAFEAEMDEELDVPKYNLDILPDAPRTQQTTVAAKPAAVKQTTQEEDELAALMM
jgi:hypothetical protein